jgi:hypothetical protein
MSKSSAPCLSTAVAAHYACQHRHEQLSAYYAVCFSAIGHVLTTQRPMFSHREDVGGRLVPAKAWQVTGMMSHRRVWWQEMAGKVKATWKRLLKSGDKTWARDLVWGSPRGRIFYHCVIVSRDSSNRSSVLVDKAHGGELMVL